MLLRSDEIQALNARYASLPEGPVDLLDAKIASPSQLETQIRAAFALFEARRRDGSVVLSDAELAAAQNRARGGEPLDELHALHEDATLWCIPTTTPILAPGGSPAYDKNRCTEIHAGEVVRVLGRYGDGWLLARVSYALGWLASPRALGPRIDPAEAKRYLEATPRAVVLRDRPQGDASLRLGISYPLVETRPDHALLPGPRGTRERALDATLARGPLPLTRRHLLSIALAHLGDPYGLGGYEGGLDCSRFLRDLFQVFAVSLPRNSASQVQAGSRTIDLAGLDAKARIEALHDANRCGVVLAQMPGHIMLILGESGERGDGAGTYVISALGDLREACPSGGDAILPINRVVVSTLGAGAGSSKGAMLTRITRLAVIGRCADSVSP